MPAVFPFAIVSGLALLGAAWVPPGVFVLCAVAYLLGAVAAPGCRALVRVMSVVTLCAFTLACWVALSWVAHASALQSLDPTTVISVRWLSAEWVRQALTDWTVRYSLIPLLLLCALCLLQNSRRPWPLLALLPIIVLPSLGVGLYQYAVDHSFCNVGIRTVSGLSADPSGFGMMLFPLLPAALCGVLWYRSRWARGAYVALALLVVAVAVLRMQRTTLFGYVLLGLVFVLLRRSLHRPAGRRLAALRRRVLVAGVLIVFAFGGVMLTTARYPAGPAAAPQVCSGRSSTASAPLLAALIRSGALRERLFHAIPVARLALAAPIAGWGAGGDLLHASNIQYQHGDYLPDVHNSCNAYLEDAASFGLLGGCLLLVLNVLPIMLAWRCIPRVAGAQQQVLLLVTSALIVWLMLGLSGPHWYNVEVLWCMSCLQAAVVVSACRTGITCGKYYGDVAVGVALVVSLVFGWGVFATSWGKQGYRALASAPWLPFTGMYPPERDFDGQVMTVRQWTGREATRVIRCAPGDVFGLRLTAAAENSTAPEGLEVRVTVDGELLDTVQLYGAGTCQTLYYVPGIGGNPVVIGLACNRTFVPATRGLSSDRRELGVMLGAEFVRDGDGRWWNTTMTPAGTAPVLIEGTVVDDKLRPPLKLMRSHLFVPGLPAGGAGLYPAETWDPALLPEYPGPLTVHWTDRRASVPLPETWREAGAALYLYANHPDLVRQPVTVRVLADGREVATCVFAAGSWQRLDLPAEMVQSATYLTVISSRTWIPARHDPRQTDQRELGVALAAWPPLP